MSRKRPLLDDAITWRVARPFASTATLGPASKKAVIPLLKGFVTELEDEGQEPEEDETIAAIDNPSNSTLTRGQQERYLKLKVDTSKSRWTPHSRREFSKLQALVKKEQDVYRQARQEYLVQHTEKFMTGFPSSEFATWHSKYTQAYVDHWKARELPLKFGKVRQIVSLSQHDSSTTWMPSEVFTSKVVEGDTKSMLNSDLPATLPRMRQPSVPQFLKDDDKVVELAKTHGSTVVVSVEALEQVLTLDSWKLALWNRQDGIRILEEPLPQPTLPRKCLEKGMEASLQCDDGAMYTLLTIKSSSKPQHILVRGRRASPRVHLEYFAERGPEQLSSQEMSCWILDSLMEPLASMQLVRVDVRDWTIQNSEPVSVAHALASGNDVVKPWNRLLSLFGALDNMPTDGDYLLCCQDLSVSLHRANDSSVEIDLEEELKNADVVKTSSAALLSCVRPWKWAEMDRAEDTFPVKKI